MNLDRVCITDPPELASRYTHDPTAENLETLEFSPEEDEKLARAARPNLIQRARDGDEEAMADLKRLHLVAWETRR